MNRIKFAISKFGDSTAFNGTHRLVAKSTLSGWEGREYRVEVSDAVFTINVISKVTDSGVQLDCCIVDYKSDDYCSEIEAKRVSKNFLASIKAELDGSIKQKNTTAEHGELIFQRLSFNVRRKGAAVDTLITLRFIEDFGRSVCERSFEIGRILYWIIGDQLDEIERVIHPSVEDYEAKLVREAYAAFALAENKWASDADIEDIEYDECFGSVRPKIRTSAIKNIVNQISAERIFTQSVNFT